MKFDQENRRVKGEEVEQKFRWPFCSTSKLKVAGKEMLEVFFLFFGGLNACSQLWNNNYWNL
jgi:hypothetical protein